VEEFGALWLAHQVSQDIDLCALVDSVIPPGDREKGSMIGEYFLYGVWNCMVEAVSKNKLATTTPSELARRGKNKAARHHLRYIGLGPLVARDSRLPVYYTVYPGNVHARKQFEAIMDEMFAIVCGLHHTKQCLTVVIEKGMNSEDNYTWIDEHAQIHFVTTYFAEHLATTPLERFEPVDIPKTRAWLMRACPRSACVRIEAVGSFG
jgi:hypothetical protein